MLRIGREIAEGLAAAHEHGLIHRDIKPGNIWLENGRGRVKLLDFGLARAVDSDGQLTSAGAIVGTPAYMSPEQANAAPLDFRTDLFSLGCVLYRMCTGVVPFPGNSTLQILRAVAESEPKSPRELNPALPAELSALVIRLLEKDRSKRPESARAIAAELAAIDDSIRATPSMHRPASKFPRWLAWTGVAVVLLSLLPGGYWLSQVVIIRDKDGKEILRAEVPKDGKLEIVDGKKDVGKAADKKGPVHREQATGFGEGPAERPAWLPKEVEIVLGDHRLNTGEGAGQIIVDAEGKQFAMLAGTSAYIGSVRNLQAVKKLTTNTAPKAAITRGSFSSDGKKVIAGFTDGTIAGWDVESGNRLFLFKAHDNCQNCLILPGGREFASTGKDGNVIVWDLATQKESFRLMNPTKGLTSGVMRAASQGDLLLVGTSQDADLKVEAEIYVLNLKTKKEECRFKAHRRYVFDVAFSHDGKQACSVGPHNSQGQTLIKRWELATGSEIGAGATLPQGTANWTNSRNFSPNGELLAYHGGKAGLVIVEVRTGREIWDLIPSGGTVRFLPDNRHVLVAASDGAVRLIDAKDGKEKHPPAGHTESVTGRVFLKDGALVSSGLDKRLLRWDIPTAKPTKQAEALTNYSVMAASPDGTVLIARNNASLEWWDTATLRNTHSEKYANMPYQCQVSPDGNFLLAGFGGESICMIDLKTGKEARKHSFSPKGDVVHLLVFHPKKATQALLCFGVSNKLVLWDVENWKEIKSYAAPTSRGRALGFGVSPDGRYCYTSDPVGTIYQVDLESSKGDVRPLAKWHTSSPTLAVSPDGRFLGSCAADGRVILWELPSGNKIQEWNFQELPGCPVPFAPNKCIFSPDSRHLVTTNSNGTIYFFRLPGAPKATQK